MREKILNMLEKNSRIDLKDMAVMLGMTEGGEAKENAGMGKKQVICGYKNPIKWGKTKEEKKKNPIEVKEKPPRGVGVDRNAESVYKNEEITSVYLMSGGFDFTVIIEGKTMKSVAQFVANKLSPLDSVLSTSTHFVLKKYKDYGRVLDAEEKDERMLVTP